MTVFKRFLIAAAVAVVGLATVCESTAVASPAVPSSGPAWTSLMHGDPESSDSTAYRGPGKNGHVVASSVPGGVCAATFVGSDGYPISLCTAYVAGTPPQFATPVVTMFDPRTAQVVARLPLTKGKLLGGVYGFLDNENRVVVADGSGRILRVGHHRAGAGWTLRIDEATDVSKQIGGDGITGLAPDYQGRTWFATTGGVIGTVLPDGRIGATHLPKGEELGNGLTIRRSGASVLTTHALYEMQADANGVPRTVWRRAYDSGAARKPGQLTWGSGTTPTYFGPGGDGWVAIVDSAAVPNLIVYNSDDGSQVCRTRAFAAANQGTENSPMAWGDSLVIPSTYGFQYPPMAVSGGPSDPAFAPFRGGMTRIDVRDGECKRVWENTTDRMATLPRLSRADGMIHGLAYGPYLPVPQQVGPVNYVAVDFQTGRRVVTRQVGVAPADEPMQLTGMIAPGGVLWQGTITRMLKIAS
ncbi:hypothetical protein [Gordonia neofelifaecis]|uniref:6-pyruvoyl tetrahydrobiopterin synthase n=1 Tax=Gordonia neofelifaecis NRRL B-59395 TaxID=644548 RepID=F1YK14_9ACTN|nr:hypothetical protein [Gordonia neofelifaecis]EGD55096.1 hypothetical protein SCNU_11221 [Gordonia neofelifaecis NRRL B-59395]